MAENFYTILTAIGKEKLSSSAVTGNKVNFKTLKIGDGKGSYYEPTESQTSLINEVWSGNITSVSVDETNSNWIIAETMLPATIGGFFIREAGIFDEAGDLIAISKLAETYKPIASEGSIKDLCIRIILEINNVESVVLKVDPNIIVATRKDIQTLEAKINDTNEQLSDLEKSMFDQNLVTPQITYGMNNVIKSTSKNSISPKFQIKGKTVINLLGKDGNCEDLSKWLAWQCTSSLDSVNKIFGTNGIKITLSTNSGDLAKLYEWDITKYYCLSAYVKNGTLSSISVAKDGNGGGVTKLGNTITDTSKFSRTFVKLQPGDYKSGDNIIIYPQGSAGQYGYADGIMLEEITQTQYNDPSFQPSPYVDGYACLQNPYIEVRHDNLVRNGSGEEGVAWWNSSNTNGTLSIVNNKFQLVTNASGGCAFVQRINVKPNTDYYVSGNIIGNMAVQIYASDNSTFIKNINNTFNSGNNIFIFVQMVIFSVSQVGSADSIMLIEGTEPPTEYKPCRIERCVVEAKLTSDDSITYENGGVTGLLYWKHKTLYGKDYDWQLSVDCTGSKILGINLSNQNILGGTNNFYAIKSDGKILGYKTSSDASDLSEINATSKIHYVNVSDSETGWAEAINPNADEVKAFMNGWQAISNNGTRYLCWRSIVDGTAPSWAIQTTAIGQASGLSYVDVADGSKFSVGDIIFIWVNATTAMATRQITSISGNRLNFLSFPFNATIAAGSPVVKCDDGSTNTSMLNYCKNNIAPNYEGYQLHYKLTSPEPITDDNCHIHGDIPKLDEGDNYLYLDSGIVIGEVANPISPGDGYTLINADNYGGYSDHLKNKVNNFNAIFRDNNYDSIWNYIDGGYGKCRAWTTVAKFDASATYTVDYKILATISPQIGSIECSYAQDVVSSINDLKEEVNNRQQHDSILDSIVDLSLYEVININGDFAISNVWGGYSYLHIVVPFKAIKKAKPTLSINISSIKMLGGYFVPMSKLNLDPIGLIFDTSHIHIVFYTNDSTVLSYGSTKGQIFGTITADCRGRI